MFTQSLPIQRDVWGVVSGSNYSSIGFTGERTDMATGLVFLHARWYNPSSGTFLSRDPFAGYPTQPYSLHPYQYGYASPLLNTDHSGRCVAGGDDWCREPKPIPSIEEIFPIYKPRRLPPNWNPLYDLLDPPACRKPVAPPVVPHKAPDYTRFDVVFPYMYNEMKVNIASEAALSIKQVLSSETRFMPYVGGPRNPVGLYPTTTALVMWFSQVFGGGPWDHKPILNSKIGADSDAFLPLRGDPDPTREVYYDIWSNIHYGYVGRFIGFDGGTLMSGANMNIPGVGAKDAGDDLSVQIGIDLWDTYGENLTQDQLLTAILSQLNEFDRLGQLDEDNSKVTYGRNLK